MLESFVQTYSSFFDFNMWLDFFSSPETWGLVLILIIMEGLLSADNALVLALMVRKLPEEQQRKALFYGLLGAYLFRFLAIGIGIFLIEFWIVKLIGSLYLYFLGLKFFYKAIKKEKNKITTSRSLDATMFGRMRRTIIAFIGPFWATVLSVELMDIVFSIDSVLAAIALTHESASVDFQMPALLLGGMIGIIMMRGIAQIFLKLLKKIPELEFMAYILIILIATKMILSLSNIHISHVLFFGVMITVFLLTIVGHYLKRKS